jgi:AraC-like DNA-binding protein
MQRSVATEQGISSNSQFRRRFQAELGSNFRALTREFPSNKNREFFEAEQGINSRAGFRRAPAENQSDVIRRRMLPARTATQSFSAGFLMRKP